MKLRNVLKWAPALLALALVVAGCEGVTTPEVTVNSGGGAGGLIGTSGWGEYEYVDLVPGGNVPVINTSVGGTTLLDIAEAFNVYDEIVFVGTSTGKISVPPGKTLYLGSGATLTGGFHVFAADHFGLPTPTPAPALAAGISTNPSTNPGRVVVLSGATVTVSAPSEVSGKLYVNKGGYINLSSYAITGTGSIYVFGRLNATGGIDLAGDLYIHAGNQYANATLDYGLVTLGSSNLAIEGALTVWGKLTTTGNIAADHNVYVGPNNGQEFGYVSAHNLTTQENVGVDGWLNLSGTAFAAGDVIVNGQVNAIVATSSEGSAIFAGGDVTVNGIANIGINGGGSNNVTGILAIGSVTVNGDGVETGKVTITVNSITSAGTITGIFAIKDVSVSGAVDLGGYLNIGGGGPYSVTSIFALGDGVGATADTVAISGSVDLSLFSAGAGINATGIWAQGNVLVTGIVGDSNPFDVGVVAAVGGAGPGNVTITGSQGVYGDVNAGGTFTLGATGVGNGATVVTGDVESGTPGPHDIYGTIYGSYTAYAGTSTIYGAVYSGVTTVDPLGGTGPTVVIDASGFVQGTADIQADTTLTINGTLDLGGSGTPSYYPANLSDGDDLFVAGTVQIAGTAKIIAKRAIDTANPEITQIVVGSGQAGANTTGYYVKPQDFARLWNATGSNKLVRGSDEITITGPGATFETGYIPVQNFQNEFIRLAATTYFNIWVTDSATTTAATYTAAGTGVATFTVAANNHVQVAKTSSTVFDLPVSVSGELSGDFELVGGRTITVASTGIIPFTDYEIGQGTYTATGSAVNVVFTGDTIDTTAGGTLRFGAAGTLTLGAGATYKLYTGVSLGNNLITVSDTGTFQSDGSGDIVLGTGGVALVAGGSLNFDAGAKLTGLGALNTTTVTAGRFDTQIRAYGIKDATNNNFLPLADLGSGTTTLTLPGWTTGTPNVYIPTGGLYLTANSDVTIKSASTILKHYTQYTYDY
jgi:hypothetical protein